jgi:hypothetical protein
MLRQRAHPLGLAEPPKAAEKAQELGLREKDRGAPGVSGEATSQIEAPELGRIMLPAVIASRALAKSDWDGAIAVMNERHATTSAARR